MVVFVLDGTHLVERLGLWCFTQPLYFSYIVVRLVEEAGVPRVNQQSVANH